MKYDDALFLLQRGRTFLTIVSQETKINVSTRNVIS